MQCRCQAAGEASSYASSAGLRPISIDLCAQMLPTRDTQLQLAHRRLPTSLNGISYNRAQACLLW